jgi:hypothetical protein
MKKMYLAVAALLLATTTSFGQVLFGVQGSGQMANLSLTPPAGANTGGLDIASFFKSKFGFRAGLMADIPVTDQLSVRPQLMYSTKGTKIDLSSLLGGVGGGVGIDPNELTATLNYNYIELPIQAMYGLDAGPGRVVLGAGPYLGYLLSGSVTSMGQTEPGNLDDTNRLDFGAALSVGYELPMGVTVSAYYSHGFANLAKSTATSTTGGGLGDPSNVTSGAGSINTRAFGLTLGYFFNTGN